MFRYIVIIVALVVAWMYLREFAVTVEDTLKVVFSWMIPPP